MSFLYFFKKRDYEISILPLHRNIYHQIPLRVLKIHHTNSSTGKEQDSGCMEPGWGGMRGRWTTDGQKGPLGVFEVFYILMLVVAWVYIIAKIQGTIHFLMCYDSHFLSDVNLFLFQYSQEGKLSVTASFMATPYQMWCWCWFLSSCSLASALL